MRKRFLAGGLEGYADHEALELLLYYAIPRRDTNPIAHALMERYGSLSAVLSAPVEDLQKVEGIGESAAILIRLALLLCRKARLEDAARATALNSTERAGKYLIELFAQEKREILYQLCLDQKGKLLASAVILSHNHPSGMAAPSADDYSATDRAKAALETVGVRLVDHIIVAGRDFLSMADSGYLS